jgi:hypothetical protein
MRLIFLGLLGLWLLGAAAFAQGLPEGTYASSKEGCPKLQSKTAGELGEDLDFYVLTGKGLTGYQQACDFLNVTAHNATGWLATAFCEEAGYSYPDLFTIAEKGEGKLTVTRLTEFMQQGAPDTSSSEAAESDQGENAGEASGEALRGGEGQDQADENAGAEQATSYVRCENVKQ